MAVEDHPGYREWRATFDYFVEMETQYREAQMTNDPAVEAFKREWERAKTAYYLVADNLT